MLVPKKTRAAWLVACGLLSVLPVSWGGQTLPAAARREALKVIRFLDRVEAESLIKKSGSPRRMVFTESELNSYIAFRIETEKEEVMRSFASSFSSGTGSKVRSSSISGIKSFRPSSSRR